MACNDCGKTEEGCGCEQEALHISQVCNPVVCDVEECSETFNAGCILYADDDIVCNDLVLVTAGDTMAQALANVAAYFCTTEATGDEVLCGVDVVVPADTNLEDALPLVVAYFCNEIANLPSTPATFNSATVSSTDVVEDPSGCVTRTYTITYYKGVDPGPYVPVDTVVFSTPPVCPQADPCSSTSVPTPNPVGFIDSVLMCRAGELGTFPVQIEWADLLATLPSRITYDLDSVQNGADADIRLLASGGSTDIVKLVAGTNITLTDTGSNITIDAASGGGNLNMINAEFGTGGNTGVFIVPPGVTQIIVEIWGAGAGTTSRQVPIGNELIICGGGGGCYKKDILNVTPGQSLNYGVGAGGTGSGSFIDRIGQPGGQTFFGSLVANGGQAASVVVGTPNVVTAGAGGNTGGVGTLEIGGGVGQVLVLPKVGIEPSIYEIGVAQGGGAGLGTGISNHSARTPFTTIVGTPVGNRGQGGALTYGNQDLTTPIFSFGNGGQGLIYITYFA
jgi:hypothetical protein